MAGGATFDAWSLPPLRAGQPADETLAKRRAAVAAAPVDPNLKFSAAQIAGVRCLIFGDLAPGADAMLYFHGGGYRLGTPEAWASFAARLSEAVGIAVIVPDYRLAPEHPFPAALHDGAALYVELGADRRLVVAGDSAGAGLAAGLIAAAQRAGAKPAHALLLLSPMLDLLARDETYDSRAGLDRFFSRANMLECADMYLQGHAPEDPLASPLYADPQAFPSTLILCGGNEVLLGEALQLGEKLARAKRTVTVHVAEDSGHVWPMLESQTQAAAAAFDMIAGFLRGLPR